MLLYWTQNCNSALPQAYLCFPFACSMCTASPYGNLTRRTDVTSATCRRNGVQAKTAFDACKWASPSRCTMARAQSSIPRDGRPEEQQQQQQLATGSKQQQRREQQRDQQQRSQNKLGAAPCAIPRSSVRSQYNPSSLAFLGDAVWETFIRQHFFGSGCQPLHVYNLAVKQHATAVQQAIYYDQLVLSSEASLADSAISTAVSDAASSRSSSTSSTSSSSSSSSSSTSDTSSGSTSSSSSGSSSSSDTSKSEDSRNDGPCSSRVASSARDVGGGATRDGEVEGMAEAGNRDEQAVSQISSSSSSSTMSNITAGTSATEGSNLQAETKDLVPEPLDGSFGTQGLPLPSTSQLAGFGARGLARGRFRVTAEERDVLRWAVNSSVISAPRGMDSLQYKKATALEVLVAFLYLTDLTRCQQLMQHLLGPAPAGGGKSKGRGSRP